MKGKPPSAPALKRGRPKDPEKRRAILEAATLRFSQLGVAGTSMDAIAADAGVSKLTLYSHFHNKEELFRQVVEAKCGEHWPEELFDTHAQLPLDERLHQIGRGFLDLIYSPEVINLYRLMAAEGARATPPGLLFWATGPELTLQRFAQILAAADAAGALHVPDPRWSAASFFSLLQAEHYLRCLIGAVAPPSAAARRKHVRDVVALFLRGHTPAR
jgi:TetR/AcrR family transcriptional repressor of mexJK operon